MVHVQELQINYDDIFAYHRGIAVDVAVDVAIMNDDFTNIYGFFMCAALMQFGKS